MTEVELKNIQILSEKVKNILIDKGIPEENINILERRKHDWYEKKDDVTVKDNFGNICETYRINAEINDADSKNTLVFNVTESAGSLKFTASDNFSVSSLAEYLEKLQNVYDDSGVTLFYRGHSSIDYKTIPSLYREVPYMSNHRFVEKESVLFRQAVLECSSDFPTSMTTFDMLVKMQHYDLPTRLLDLTKNSLIALYFAARSNIGKKDGEVLIYKIPKKEICYFNGDKVCILSNIAKQKDDTFQIPDKLCETDEEIKIFNRTDEIECLLHDIRNEMTHFYPIIRKRDMQSVICVLPRKNSPRIIAQDGAFFLYGIKGKKTECAINKYVPSRIIIKAEKKQQILNELKRISIDDAHIYQTLENRLSQIKNNFADF